MTRSQQGHVLAFCGGIGGAKLALGLSQIVPPHDFTIVVNTGDDFEHLGLHIAPDIDTVTYTLAGVNDPEKGWGRAEETWSFMDSLRSLGGEDWFNIGDKDLALHIERTRMLNGGATLSHVTNHMCRALSVEPTIVPMSDAPVRTLVDTPNGTLSFQHYFVRDKCAPQVKAIRFEGADTAAPAPGLVTTFGHPDLSAIVICPSNPYLSIDPILAVDRTRQMLTERRAPCIAVAPIVGGAAVKGPTGKIMQELDLEVSTTSVAKHYGGLIDGYVVDETDTAEVDRLTELGLAVRTAPIVMQSLQDRIDLGRHVLDFASELRDAGKPD